jgi:hypothetical protein
MIALAGCTSLRGKADAAYSSGNYVGAAGMYDQLGDAGRRDQARAAELRAELWRVQNAGGSLEELLDNRDTWHLPGPDGLPPVIEAASDRIRRAVSAATWKDGPLAGEAELATHSALLAHADFAQTRDAIHAQLLEVGQTRCTQLGGIMDAPYWQAVVARYCGHFSVEHAVPPLPDHQSAFVIDGQLAGESAGEISSLRTALVAAFQKSAWYAPTGVSTRHAKVDGRVDVAFSSREVTLTASWTEQVPYTDYETTQESYQEPYDDTETYDEQVPDTEWVQCGESTCPQTVYHTETKTRTVTKYRTAWRDVTTPVTKYRDEPRTQDYQATERTGTYSGVAAVTLADDLVASIEAKDGEHGYDHDVTIGPAGVAPQRANLPSQEDFATRIENAVAQRMIDVLDAEYGRRFCTLSTYTLEQAAECAYGTRQVPDRAQITLRDVFGGETPYLKAL